jgi:hypothetical protein
LGFIDGAAQSYEAPGPRAVAVNDATCSFAHTSPPVPQGQHRAGQSQRYIGRMGKGWTFQSLIGLTVTAYCHTSACHHSQVLDLAKLRDRFGPDASAMADDLTPKLKCAKCGGKNVGLIYSPDTSPNAYRKASQ